MNLNNRKLFHKDRLHVGGIRNEMHRRTEENK